MHNNFIVFFIEKEYERKRKIEEEKMAKEEAERLTEENVKNL